MGKSEKVLKIFDGTEPLKILMEALRFVVESKICLRAQPKIKLK